MKAFVFDTETTGLVHFSGLPLDELPHIIEIYGVVVDLATGERGMMIDTLVRPPVEITDEIVGITGIDNNMVEATPTWKFNVAQLKAVLASAEAVIAHNLSYDMMMVDTEMRRIGDSVDWPPVRLCTAEQSVHLHSKRLNMQALHEHYIGEKFKDAHRAAPDVEALIRVALAMAAAGDLPS